MIEKLLKALVFLLIIGVFGFLGYIVSSKRFGTAEQVRPTTVKQTFPGNIWKYLPDVVASGVYHKEGYLQIGEYKQFLSGDDVYFGSLYQLDNMGYFTLVNGNNLTDGSRIYFDFYHSKDWIIGTLKTRSGDAVTYEHDPKNLTYSIGSKGKDFFVTDPSNSFGLRKDRPEDVKPGSILEITPKYYVHIAPPLRPIIGKAVLAEKTDSSLHVWVGETGVPVVIDSKTTLVYDYKTRKTMSFSDIKPNTKIYVMYYFKYKTLFAKEVGIDL